MFMYHGLIETHFHTEGLTEQNVVISCALTVYHWLALFLASFIPGEKSEYLSDEVAVWASCRTQKQSHPCN